jgi:hypothetical protein
MSIITIEKLTDLLFDDLNRIASIINTLNSGNFLMTCYVNKSKDKMTAKGEVEAKKISAKYIKLIKDANNLNNAINKAIAEPNPSRHMALRPNKRGMMTTNWAGEIEELLKHVDKLTEKRMEFRAH